MSYSIPVQTADGHVCLLDCSGVTGAGQYCIPMQTADGQIVLVEVRPVTTYNQHCIRAQTADGHVVLVTTAVTVPVWYLIVVTPQNYNVVSRVGVLGKGKYFAFGTKIWQGYTNAHPEWTDPYTDPAWNGYTRVDMDYYLYRNDDVIAERTSGLNGGSQIGLEVVPFGHAAYGIAIPYSYNGNQTPNGIKLYMRWVDGTSDLPIRIRIQRMYYQGGAFTFSEDFKANEGDPYWWVRMVPNSDIIGEGEAIIPAGIDGYTDIIPLVTNLVSSSSSSAS